MLHIPPTNLLLLAAKQEPYKKAHLLTRNIDTKNFPERVQENGPAGRRKDKTERVIQLGRRTREEILKWNRMTALRFQTGGSHQTSPASLRGSGLRETFIKRYIVKRTNKAEIRPEEQCKKGGELLREFME